MISHAEFGRLRLRQVLPRADVLDGDMYEFLDHTWVHESIGAFTTLNRLEDDPEVSRCMEVDFDALPEDDGRRLMESIGLPVRKGMSFDELRAEFGEPKEVETYSDDRDSYEFLIGAGHGRYHVNCTVLRNGGLIYLVVHSPLPRSPGGAR